MENRKYEFVIVGSGAGGGTLARELARRGKDVLVVERGRPEKKIGTFLDCYRYFDMKELPPVFPRFMRKIPLAPPTSREGIILWRAIMAGGTTVISCGNGARCMERELAELGVSLTEEFAEAEQEMGIAPVAERLLSAGSKAIRAAAREVGAPMQPMPKFLKMDRCTKCGVCHFGCVRGAKWTSLEYLDEAVEQGAAVLYDTAVRELIIDNDRVTGLGGCGPRGRVRIEAGTVILAAGGIATPVILQRSGISEAGKGLFLDIFHNTYGCTDGINQIHEPVMALVNLENHHDGFLLSPFVNNTSMGRMVEMSPVRAFRPSNRFMGIMTKISDAPNGRVYPDGSFSKPVTVRDRERLGRGAALARRILEKGGADPASLFESRLQGAHPGGTAAIGTVVDGTLQTRKKNLYVCDASVLPAAHFPDSARMPPILTIVALAKKLAKNLA